MEILDNIPFEVDTDALLSSVHVEEGSEDARDIRELVEVAAPLARPKAIYEVSYIEHKDHDTVDIGDVRFISRVLRVNLDAVERVFPFVATCGKELEEISIPSDDFMRRFWLDAIKGMALSASGKYLREHLERTYALGKMSSMRPGSGATDLWPIEQQKPLFSIFGDVEDLIGVRLTDSFLMLPNKSSSGIYFPTEITFQTCRLCPREVCPSRSAAYDPNLVESYYGDHPGS